MAETAKLYARQGATFHLVGRNPQKLDAVAESLRALGAKGVQVQSADFADFSTHGAVIARALQELGSPELVLVGHAVFGDAPGEYTDFACVENYMRVNFLSVVSLLSPLLKHLIDTKARAQLVVLSSVAGDRGKARNFAYGISKAALSAYLQALRNSLEPHGIRVLTVKPGPVRTPMTAHLKKLPLVTSAEAVARGIQRAVSAQREVIYLPWFWRPIMAAIRALPERWFKRMRL